MPSRKFQIWSAWFIVSFFYAYQYVLRVIPSVMMDDIKTRFAFSAESFGQFSGIYYIGYSLMNLPLGAILDRYGAKKTLPFFIALTVAGILPIVYCDHWIYPIIGRLMVGMGSSAAILGVFKIIQVSFEKTFSRMLSYSVAIGLAGAIYGGRPILSA